MTMRFGSSRSPMASGAKRSLIRPSLQLAGKGGGELVLELAALDLAGRIGRDVVDEEVVPRPLEVRQVRALQAELVEHRDRKSTRLNSSHLVISYAVFCL